MARERGVTWPAQPSWTCPACLVLVGRCSFAFASRARRIILKGRAAKNAHSPSPSSSLRTSPKRTGGCPRSAAATRTVAEPATTRRAPVSSGSTLNYSHPPRLCEAAGEGERSVSKTRYGSSVLLQAYVNQPPASALHDAVLRHQVRPEAHADEVRIGGDRLGSVVRSAAGTVAGGRSGHGSRVARVDINGSVKAAEHEPSVLSPDSLPRDAAIGATKTKAARQRFERRQARAARGGMLVVTNKGYRLEIPLDESLHGRESGKRSSRGIESLSEGTDGSAYLFGLTVPPTIWTRPSSR